jgi:membrane-associated phospholipid phosphatase
MFQIEPILWLQSIGTPPLTWLLLGVTLLGYAPVYVVLSLVMAFARRLRPTLAVLGGLLLSALLTEGFKDAVAFPRPDEVDSRVKKSFASLPIQLHERGGAPGFWSLPQPGAIEAVRRRAAGNYGFPSGHVSAAAAFLLCTAFFFRSRRVLAFAALWVPLIALSRLYLGRHFVGDVLGGFAIGGFAAALAVLLFHTLDDEAFRRHDRRARAAFLPLALLSLVLLAAAPYTPLLQPRYVGALAGLVVSYGFLLVSGLPPDGGPPRQRALRIALAGLVFLAGLAATQALVAVVGRNGERVALLASTSLAVAATFAGTVTLCRRLGLYSPASG